MGNRTVRTDRKRDVFLATLAQAGNVSQACRTAGIGYTTVYKWREEDHDFAAAWEVALKQAIDRLEGEAWRRAVEGVEKPVYQQGVMVGTVTEHSDRLMEVLLKAHGGDKYRDKVKADLSGSVTIKIAGDAADL